MNQTPLDVLKNSLLAAFGLFCFGVGVYLTIQANIGVAPWDAFCIGLSQKLGILCGTASIMMSLTIVVIDQLLKERIGILVIVLAIGWVLDGPIGIGTVISTFCMGPMMQLAFALVKFDATKVQHQDLIQSLKVLSAKSNFFS